jgi:class 3 adenylate cyclase
MQNIYSTFAKTYFCCLFCLVITSVSCFAQDEASARLEAMVQRGESKNAVNEALRIAKSLHEQKQDHSALTYYLKAVEIAEKSNDLALRAKAHEELGDAYYRLNEADKAVRNFNAAAQYYANVGAVQAQTLVINRIGYTEKNKKGNIDAAIAHFKRSLQIAQQNNIFASQLKSYELLASAYDEKKDFYNAQVYRNSYNQLKNTPNSDKIDKYETELQATKQQLEQIRASNETQKRELQYKIQNIEKEKNKLNIELTLQADSLERANYEAKMAEARAVAVAEEKKRTQTQLYFSLGGIVLLLVFSVFLFSLYRSRNIANKKLAEQHIQLKKQAEELERKGKELQKEKEKSERLLLNILPAKVAEELKENNYAAPRYYEMVTVLFTDFKGFTNIAAQMTPEQIVKELNMIFSEFDRICKEYRLEKIKTIGDAYMCAGGIPEPNTTNHIDAVNAAMEMQNYMRVLAEKRQAVGEHYFELRLGINTGPIVAGVVGESKFAYDIWGDTVNLASRMESGGEPGRVNISGNTYELVKDYFDCTYRGKISVKNKGDVDMYFVNYKKWW